jgi:hypothetical protein
LRFAPAREKLPPARGHPALVEKQTFANPQLSLLQRMVLQMASVNVNGDPCLFRKPYPGVLLR